MNLGRKESSEIGIESISFYYEEMVRSNLMELEVETPGGKIVLKRLSKENPSKAQFPLKRRTDFVDILPEPPPSSFKTIASPIMGVFYRASSPQSPPLVKEGDAVEQGATLCIVEAMKVMNEIKAESRCKIVKILVENSKPVTKDQPLFHVDPF